MRFYGHGRFQSTHSLRSATGAVNPHWSRPRVSIHALLAECDGGQHVLPACFSGFNPRTPCGVRPKSSRAGATSQGFQSTHSLRSATNCKCKCKCSMWFQSTHSLRSATDGSLPGKRNLRVSIHALLAECDCAQPYTLLLNKANHTLRQPP